MRSEGGARKVFTRVFRVGYKLPGKGGNKGGPRGKNILKVFV